MKSEPETTSQTNLILDFVFNHYEDLKYKRNVDQSTFRNNKNALAREAAGLFGTGVTSSEVEISGTNVIREEMIKTGYDIGNSMDDRDFDNFYYTYANFVVDVRRVLLSEGRLDPSDYRIKRAVSPDIEAYELVGFNKLDIKQGSGSGPSIVF